MNRRFCPADGAALRDTRSDSHDCAVCDKCHGLWLSEAFLKKCLRVRHDPTPQRPSQPLRSARDLKRFCPDCRTLRLLAIPKNGIETDICPRCFGVWLDGGELQQIIAKASEQARRVGSLQATSPGFRLRSSPTGWDSFLDGLAQASPDLVNPAADALVEIASSLLEALCSDW
jgi:Zn-finger nucleic acid-binding protein